MIKIRDSHWLLLIFLAVLAGRLYLAFTIPNFTYESYFHLRQVNEIKETGFPLFYDPLSYGGRELRFLPFFHYVAAVVALFLPLELVGKILPNLLLASLTIIVYFLAKQIAGREDKTGPLLAALIAGFLPILYRTNSFTPEALFIPLLFICIYAFFSIHQKIPFYVYSISFILLSFTSSSTALLLLGFGLYLLLSKIEGKKIDRMEVEVIIASLFFFIWVQFLFFKRTLLKEGINFVWQNIPAPILTQYFPKFSLPEAVIAVSIIPFAAGIFVVYRSLFRLKNQKSFLLISFVVSAAIVTWFRLIQFRLALTFFGIILSILFSLFYSDVHQYIKKTRIHRYHRFLPLLLVVVLVATLLPPAWNAARHQETPADQEIAAFQWMQEHLPTDATVAASLEEGHLITYFSQRKNVMGDQFTLIPDVEQRFHDLTTVFTSSFLTEAIGIFDKYGVSYLVLTPHTQKKYGLTKPKYHTIDCLERAYKDETLIYRLKCSLEKQPLNETRSIE